MSDEEEWGPWQNHDGKGCLCVGMWVQAIHQNWDGPLIEGIAGLAGNRDWVWATAVFPIIRFRIRKPRALREMIQWVENLPVREDA